MMTIQASGFTERTAAMAASTELVSKKFLSES